MSARPRSCPSGVDVFLSTLNAPTPHGVGVTSAPYGPPFRSGSYDPYGSQQTEWPPIRRQPTARCEWWRPGRTGTDLGGSRLVAPDGAPCPRVAPTQAALAEHSASPHGRTQGAAHLSARPNRSRARHAPRPPDDPSCPAALVSLRKHHTAPLKPDGSSHATSGTGIFTVRHVNSTRAQTTPRRAGYLVVSGRSARSEGRTLRYVSASRTLSLQGGRRTTASHQSRARSVPASLTSATPDHAYQRAIRRLDRVPRRHASLRRRPTPTACAVSVRSPSLRPPIGPCSPNELPTRRGCRPRRGPRTQVTARARRELWVRSYEVPANRSFRCGQRLPTPGDLTPSSRSRLPSLG